MKHLLFALISSPILAFAGNYTTNFASPPAPENPISENRMWINGADTGILWSNCRTSSNFAYGTQPGNLTGDAMYADSIAVLAGTWGPNQSATATIKLVSALRVYLQKLKLDYAVPLLLIGLLVMNLILLYLLMEIICIAK